MLRQLSLVLRAELKGFGWQSSGRKERFIVWHSMKAAIPTSKLTRGLLHSCVETIGLALFLQQEHRVQQAQGAFAPVQHFNLLHVFFHVLA